MKAILLILILLIVGLVVGAFYVKQEIGDIRPAFMPANPAIKKALEQKNPLLNNEGVDPNFPLKVPAGYKITVFAKDLGPVRDLQFTPNGTLVASVPDRGKVIAISDTDNDGVADKVNDLIIDLQKPHGLAYFEGFLYVAEESEVTRYGFNESSGLATKVKNIANLPTGGDHSSRSLTFDKFGALFISVGSTCNVCTESNPNVASILQSDGSGYKLYPDVYARGLRNAAFIKYDPVRNQIWATEMGRDFLGDSLPADEINIIYKEANYGWPYCFGDKSIDSRFDPKKTHQEFCDKSTPPLYKIPAHSAPLGLNFIYSSKFPAEWQGDLLVSYHGSWNSTTPVGYKVVRMHVENDQIATVEDFVTGFLQGSSALGRPVDLEFDSNGDLYISDDKGGYIYRVTAAQ